MPQDKKLINNADDVVMEMIEGLVETYPHLQYLDGFPEVKVVLQADAVHNKVAVISGGGSGHEPAFAGYVGTSMLTASACGDVFASPSVSAILAAIRAVTGPPGCLLIAANYTGDRLNFGAAAEQAKLEGLRIEMYDTARLFYPMYNTRDTPYDMAPDISKTLFVGDDCSLPPRRGIAGRRGLAGTLFVLKVAGAAAYAGLDLIDVAKEARRVASLVGSMGVGLTVGTLPGQLILENRLGPGKMELGLGIHGEPGAAVANIQPVDVVVSHVLNQILSLETQYVPIQRGCRVAVMINGLGSTPLMELMIIAGKAVAQLQLDYGMAVERVYTGSFLTSLDTAGFSLSILKVDDLILKRLDTPTKAPAWPVGVDGPRPPTTIPVPLPPVPLSLQMVPSRPQELTWQGHIFEVAIIAGAQAIIELKDTLNDLDRKVGDGDCGTTMWKGATAILEDLKKHYPLNDAIATVNEIGISIRRVMGGTSGVLYDIFSKAAFARMRESSEPVSAKLWVSAFDAAVSAVSKYGGASAGQRTFLDALMPASRTLQELLAQGESGINAFLAASEAALQGAEATKMMRAQTGRSSYIPEKILAETPDPGAIAAAAWFREAALAIAEACDQAKF